MIKDSTRRELIAKLGIGAASALAATTLTNTAQAQTCHPTQLQVDRLRPITVNAVKVNQMFAVRVQGTVTGFALTSSGPLADIDPASLGVSSDGHSLNLAVQVSSQAATLTGLDGIMAASTSGRCHFKNVAGTQTLRFA